MKTNNDYCRHPSRVMPGLKDDGFEDSEESGEENQARRPPAFCGAAAFRERREDRHGNGGGHTGQGSHVVV